MSLTTQYHGLAMKNPAIASASLLNGRIDDLRRLGCCHPGFRGAPGDQSPWRLREVPSCAFTTEGGSRAQRQEIQMKNQNVFAFIRVQELRSECFSVQRCRQRVERIRTDDAIHICTTRAGSVVGGGATGQASQS
jgi:hypothetical protein